MQNFRSFFSPAIEIPFMRKVFRFTPSILSFKKRIFDKLTQNETHHLSLNKRTRSPMPRNKVWEHT